MACGTGEGAERLRGQKIERLTGDPNHLIRTIPAKENRLAGLVMSAEMPSGRDGVRQHPLPSQARAPDRQRPFANSRGRTLYCRQLGIAGSSADDVARELIGRYRSSNIPESASLPRWGCRLGEEERLPPLFTSPTHTASLHSWTYVLGAAVLLTYVGAVAIRYCPEDRACQFGMCEGVARRGPGECAIPGPGGMPWYLCQLYVEQAVFGHIRVGSRPIGLVRGAVRRCQVRSMK